MFLACQWTDEQTGGHCPALASRFTGTERKWFTFTNGTHIDSLDPETLQPLVRLPRALRRRAKTGARHRRSSAAPRRRSTRRVMGVPGVSFPTTRSSSSPTTTRPWRRSRRCRRSGSCSTTAPAATPGDAVCRPSSSRSSASRCRGPRRARWYLARRRQARATSPRERRRRRVHLGPGGAPADRLHRQHRLRPGRPVDRHARLRLDAEPRRDRALSYVSPPLSADTAVLGAGAFEVWVRSSARNVDLQATVSEVRPDGKETLRAERLAADRRPQARPRAEHASSSRCRATASATRRPLPRGPLGRR